MEHDRPVTVLLVEDNQGDVRLIQAALEESERIRFKLETTTRLSSAMTKLAEGGIDVILLDLTLPDSQGLYTLLQMQSQAPDVPVLILTGLEDEDVAVEAVQKGAQDYVSKNFIATERHFLILAIRYALARKATVNELSRLATFPEHAPVAIVECDGQGRLLYVNPRASEQLPDLASGRPGHPVMQAIQEAAAAGRPVLVEHGGRRFVCAVAALSQPPVVRAYLSEIPSS